MLFFFGWGKLDESSSFSKTCYGFKLNFLDVKNFTLSGIVHMLRGFNVRALSVHKSL